MLALRELIMDEKGRTRRLAVAVSLGVAGTLAVLRLTDLGTTFPHGPRVQIAIQICGAIVLCIAAALVFKRFHTDAHRRAAGLVPATQRLSDVVLACALGFLATTTVVFSAIPGILAENPGAFTLWGQLLGQVSGIAAVAVAACIPTARAIRYRVTPRQTAGVIAGALL